MCQSHEYGCNCCGICTSRKGCALFVISVHLFIFLRYFFMYAILPVFSESELDELHQVKRYQIVYALIVVYTAVHITAGCMNFIAVEVESPKILCLGLFVIFGLQMLQLIGNILLGFVMPDLDADSGVHQIHHIHYIILGVVGAALYLWLLSSYRKTMLNDKYSLKFRKENKATAPPASPDYSDMETLTLKRGSGKGFQVARL